MIKKVLPLIFTSLLFLSVGYSAFLVQNDANQAQIYGNGETRILTDDYVIFDYNDGSYTDDFYYALDDTGTIDPSIVPASSTDTSTHAFKGWSIDKAGAQMITNWSSLSYTGGQRFYAQYTVSQLTLGTSTVINSASYSNPYFFSNSSISSGQKVVISYDSSEYEDSDYSTSNTIVRLSEASMTVVLQNNLTIKAGTLSMNSVLGFQSASYTQQIISDPTKFVVLDLNGFTITITGGGALEGYGIILNSKNTGGIIVENGNLTTPFCVYDFKGGSYLLTAYCNTVAPFTNYFSPYLNCETIFYPNGKLLGSTSLNASGTKYSTTISFVGNSDDYFINLSDGYLIRKTKNYIDAFFTYTPGATAAVYTAIDPSYRENLIFTDDPSERLISLDATLFPKSTQCTVKLNSLSLSVSGATAELKYVDFPISSFLDIELYNTHLTFGISFVFLPSSSFYCDADSVIKFSYSSASSYTIFSRISVMEEYPKDFFYYKDGTKQSRSSGLYLTNHYLYETVAPSIIIDGTFDFDTSATINMSNSYSYHTIGGRIKCSEAAIASLKNNCSRIRLSGRFFYPLFVSDSTNSGSSSNPALTDAASYYCSQPLYYDDTAYFQIDSSNEITEGEYDSTLHLIKYSGQYYFYKYSTDGFNQSSYKKLNLVGSATSAPSSTKVAGKTDNLNGSFAACSVRYFQFNELMQIPYVEYNGSFYIYLLGAYILLASEPTGNIVNISSTCKFSFSLDYFTFSSKAIYINGIWKFGL